MSTTDAVRRELAALEKRRPGLSKSMLAAAALQMAAELDGDNSATSKSMCARVLMEIEKELRSLVPDEQEKDALDELTARRQARLARGAKS